jgi:adenylate cyclase
MDSSGEPVRLTRPAEKRRRVPVSAIMAVSFGTLVFLSVGGVLALTVAANLRNTLDLLGAQSTLLVDAMEDSLRAEMGQSESAVRGVAQLYTQDEFRIDDNEAMSAALSGALSAARQATAMLICTPDTVCRGVARAAKGTIEVLPPEPEKCLPSWSSAGKPTG